MSAYPQTLSRTPPQQYAHTSQHTPRRHPSKQRFVADLSQCLFDFVIQLLPTTEEMAVKEDVRKLLERLIRTIEPQSRLQSFGSSANGFSLRNSDMDLCCLIDSDERLAATDLVTMLGDLLERETKFHVKPLPHARIPIVKLSLDPSPGLPLGIACDIGFENRLALENTRLLMCYAMVDPTRVRTMVLFRVSLRAVDQSKFGAKDVHVKNPPVLPNLQHMPPLRPITTEDTHLAGYNTWFFDDIELLRQRWHSANTEGVAELLIDFFRYYSRDFSYNTGVASIRAGLLKKDSKGWQNDLSSGKFNDSRERNRLCIEDPFEIDFNVARCVTKDGLYTIRGEFMRASRILAGRPDRAVLALAELCEERKDEYLASPPPFVPPRLSPLPPQTPYTVGSSPMRPKGVPVPGRPSSPTQASESGPHKLAVQRVSTHAPPEHMAPKRGKWTSPPLPEASSADHTYFEDQLGIGLELATASTEAREREATYNSSSSNSEVFSDDEHPSDLAESDDATSVRSFTEGFTSSPLPFRRPSRLNPHNSSSRTLPSCSSPADPIVRSNSGGRGRLSSREKSNEIPPEISSRQLTNLLSLPSRTEVSRRSLSGPPRSLNGHSWSSNTPVALATPLPPSPDHSKVPHNMELSTVFYQTTTRSPRPTALYPNVGLQSPLFPQYPSHQYHIPPTGTTSQDTSPLEQPLVNPRSSILTEGRSSAGPDTPTPGSYSRSTHSHSHSASTVTQGITPTLSNSSQPAVISSSLTAPSPPPSSSPTMSPGHRFDTQINGSTLLHASISEEGSSSTPSSTGYTTSLSRSPSPSLPPTATLVPTNRKTDLQKRTVRYPLQSKY